MEMPIIRAIAGEMRGSGNVSETARIPNFLVIDDDPVQRMTISKVGAKAGYRAVAVATVEDAMREIRQQKFDCVTLDLLLGGQNGMLMLSEIADFNPNALLIVVSGASPAVRESTLGMATALHLNAAELPKPLDLASLRILLTNHVNAVGAP